MNERIVALDVGDARIGVAVSDASRLIASPVEVIHRVGFGPDVKRVQEICRRYDTTLILSGLPLNLKKSGLWCIIRMSASPPSPRKTPSWSRTCTGPSGGRPWTRWLRR